MNYHIKRILELTFYKQRTLSAYMKRISISYKRTDGVLRVEKRVLRVDKRVLQVNKRALRVLRVVKRVL